MSIDYEMFFWIVLSLIILAYWLFGLYQILIEFIKSRKE